MLRVQRCGRSVLKMAAADFIRRSPCAMSAPLYQARKNCPYGVSQLPPQLLEEPSLLQGKLVASGFAIYASLQREFGLPSAPTSFIMVALAFQNAVHGPHRELEKGSDNAY